MSLLAVIDRSTSNLLGAAAEGAVTVDVDLSLFVQLGLFVVLLLVLKPTLFDPMMKLFEEREARIEGTRNQATKTDIKSAKAKAKADAIVAKGREEGTAQRETLRAEGVKREAELMNLVRAATTKTLEEGRAATGSEADAARKQLRLDAHALGREMAARVLGREVAS
jgi:F-type H+-transporting ATPase subunit b